MMRDRGILVFVGLSCLMSWIPAWLLAGAWAQAPEPSSRALLHASLLYTAVLGWQPFVAVLLARRFADDERPVDSGIRAAPPFYRWVGLVAPVALLGAATVLDGIIWNGTDTGPRVAVPATWTAIVSSGLALIGIVAMLWLQALGEELGWRGYLLGRLMRQIGAWPGLLVHGALWGIWYAPIILLAGGDNATERMAEFVLTCALLGALLGWLRLASRSILVSAASNSILTISAGLPMILLGSSSARTAVYEPGGWIPLVVALVVISVIAPLRSHVTAPMMAGNGSTSTRPGAQ